MSDSLRKRMISKLYDLGVDEDMVAESFASVVRGQTRKEVYKNDEGELKLSRVEVTTKPEDQLRGLVALDVLSGGLYGIANEQLLPGRHNNVGDSLSRKKITGVVDVGILRNKEVHDSVKDS